MDNPSAFPFQPAHFHEAGEPSYGMTLRDWFAGQALNGNLAAEDMGDGEVYRLRAPENASLMAARAYQMADAMLAARAEQSS